MFTNLLAWILFSLPFSQTSLKIAIAQGDKTTCSPFRLLVIWHTSNGDDAVYAEQRRLIIRLLLNIPQGTEIQVTAINTRLHHLLYTKENITVKSMSNISMFHPNNSTMHIVQETLINTLISSFVKQNENKEIAEKILLVVSEKTEIKKCWKPIKNVELVVVFTGRNQPAPMWTSLAATDKHHLVPLNTTFSAEHTNDTADTVLELLCRVAIAQGDKTTCSPFRLLVIWHTSNGDDAVYAEQRRLIIRLLLNIPQGTEIQVTAINTRLHHLLYTKENITVKSMSNISMFHPNNLTMHIVQETLINTLISSFVKQNENKEIAEKILLVVSKKTKIKKSWKPIKNVELVVVFTGRTPPAPMWTSLAATDKHHLVPLNTTFSAEHTNDTADTVLDLFCRVAIAQGDKTTCSPFRLLVIWHTNNGQGAVYAIQKRLIIYLLLKIPQGTEIQVTAINTRLHHLLYTKENIAIESMHNISLFKSNFSRKHILHESLINKLISSFVKQKENKKIAEKILLVVSEKTEIKKSWKPIENVKLVVVFTGRNQPAPMWTFLAATEKHHLVPLKTTFSAAYTIDRANTVLELFCRDHRRHSLKHTDNEADRNVTGKSFKQKYDHIAEWIITVVASPAIVTVFVLLCLILKNKWRF